MFFEKLKKKIRSDAIPHPARQCAWASRCCAWPVRVFSVLATFEGGWGGAPAPNCRRLIASGAQGQHARPLLLHCRRRQICAFSHVASNRKVIFDCEPNSMNSTRSRTSRESLKSVQVRNEVQSIFKYFIFSTFSIISILRTNHFVWKLVRILFVIVKFQGSRQRISRNVAPARRFAQISARGHVSTRSFATKRCRPGSFGMNHETIATSIYVYQFSDTMVGTKCRY